MYHLVHRFIDKINDVLALPRGDIILTGRIDLNKAYFLIVGAGLQKAVF